MKKLMTAAALLVAGTALAVAQAPKTGDLPAAAKDDMPGATGGGTTANPTAKPKSGDLADEAQKDAPGTTGGSTAEPTAKPQSSDLGSKKTNN